MTILQTTKTKSKGLFHLREENDPILRTPTNYITSFHRDIAILAESMYDFLDDNAIGLAANQIGVNLRLFVYKLASGQPSAIINPEIVDCHGVPEFSIEGCLSFPGKLFLIKRHPSIKVHGYDLAGDDIYIDGYKADISAFLFQHEIDHLNGILPIDICENWVEQWQDQRK